MADPIAVIISDVHYSLNTRHLADKAFRAAIDKAAELNVPLIDAGDITNDKAILRAEVVNMLIATMEYAASKKVKVWLMVGNHSLVNEKGTENALGFLAPYADIIDKPANCWLGNTHVGFIPYQSNLETLKRIISSSYQKILICHQGFLGAQMGDYIQDKTSIDPELVKDFTVISGHYHRHQTIGTVTYVGSPYTITFGEANDGPKGFLVLNSDGTFTREILNLRKHVIVECTTRDLYDDKYRAIYVYVSAYANREDLIWLKVSGPRSQLKSINKQELGTKLLGRTNFRLDLIPDNDSIVEAKTEKMTDTQVLDSLIDASGDTEEQKKYLKDLYKELI